MYSIVLVMWSLWWWWHVRFWPTPHYPSAINIQKKTETIWRPGIPSARKNAFLQHCICHREMSQPALNLLLAAILHLNISVFVNNAWMLLLNLKRQFCPTAVFPLTLEKMGWTCQLASLIITVLLFYTVLFDPFIIFTTKECPRQNMQYSCWSITIKLWYFCEDPKVFFLLFQRSFSLLFVI